MDYAFRGQTQTNAEYMLHTNQTYHTVQNKMTSNQYHTCSKIKLNCKLTVLCLIGPIPSNRSLIIPEAKQGPLEK